MTGVEHQASCNLSLNPCKAPTKMPNCVHGITGSAVSTPPSSFFFNLFLASTWSVSYVSGSAPIHYQLRQADITDHLFLDHLDFAQVVPYLALGILVILFFSVQFSSHSKTNMTPFLPPNLFDAILLCRKGLYFCLQACFRLFRRDKHVVLMFLTRSLTTPGTSAQPRWLAEDVNPHLPPP